MTRFAGGPGVAGVVVVAAEAGVAGLAAAGVMLAAAGCSVGATDAGGASTTADGACGTGAGGGTLATAAAAGFASCGVLFAGTATTAGAPVNPDDGGFTITGPCGAREAIAGVGVGVGDTIWGACRGNGTIFRGAGFEPAGLAAAAGAAGAALTGVLTEAGLLPDGEATGELGAGAETVGFAIPAAAAVTVGRGGAVIAPRRIPCNSRCSFCC